MTIKPLTTAMIEVMLDYNEKEMMNLLLRDASITTSIGGLIPISNRSVARAKL